MVSRANFVLVVGVLWAGFAVAQTQPPPSSDRRDGEEDRIRQRIEWFVQTRGLDRVSRADRLRRDAVLAVKAARDADSGGWSPQWTPLGPNSMTMLDWQIGDVSGRVSALAVHPEDEDIIFLGSASGGLWKTINGGGSWTPIFDDVGTQTIGSVVIDPSSPDTLWVGTGEQGQSCWSYFGMGLFRSTDGGESFEPVNGSGSETLDLSFITGIAVHPSRPGNIVVGGETWCDDGLYLYGGLYRSTDGGASWQRQISGAVTDVIADPSTPDTLFSAVGRWSNDVNGVYRSTDAGATWTRLEGGLPVGAQVGRTRLAMAPSDSRTIYALMNHGSGVELYRSTDGGDTWAVTNPDACDGQCWYNLCLAVHPSDASRLLVGSVRFYASLNAGATLAPLIDYWGPGQTVHQDVHVLVYSRLDPNRFWVAGDGGIWRSDTGGDRFENLNANLNLTQFYDIAVHPSDRATVFGGSQDNSSSATIGDLRWDVTVVTGDGFINVVDSENPQIVLQTSYPYEGYPTLYKSDAGGVPNSFDWLWLNGVTQNEPWPWVTPFASVASGSGNNHLLLGSDHVYLSSTAHPRQWTKVSGDLTGATGSLSVLLPVANETAVMVYAGTGNGRIHRTDDVLAASPEWVDVTGNYPGDTVTDVAVDPQDPLAVLITRGQFNDSRLYRSDTGGTTWQAVGAGLPNVPANAVVVDPLDGHRVFVGTDVGVFVSTDRGLSFEPIADDLPLGLVVTDLEVDGDPHILTAGTYGRGAWQIELSPPPVFNDGFESGNLSAWTTTGP